MKKIISVVGARPNFIKIAPVDKAFRKYDKDILHLICHTGQHFDKKMSDVFFDELEMPRPSFYLGINSGSHAEQTARIMIEFEKVLLNEKPDLILVPGDVNSTMACSLVASKMGIPIGHVESGLRSFDREMPEEINRVVTDVLSDLLFVSEESGLRHLKNEGIDEKKVHFVGNVMIDSLIHYMPKIDQSKIIEYLNNTYKDARIEKKKFVLVTFHRPSNVDSEEGLRELTDFLNRLADLRPVVFPIHPRTRQNMDQYGLLSRLHSQIITTDPIGYIDFLALTKNAELVITDSGGIQEETTFLGVQCITVRNNTERPITVKVGTNQLIGTDLEKVQQVAKEVLSGKQKTGVIPELWDGRTADRIAKICFNFSRGIN
ncbi:MAG: UDP-N-acetylglucosamine 2-epimerase (non-hydrolyzing) [Bacteroidetes bacterium]|nr:UDP-N-acetylglucosamine 2-epimerase (non-hydrolyzing) [Bacteroidota bacterium]